MSQNNKKKRARNLAALGVTGAAIFKILKAVNDDRNGPFELWSDVNAKENIFGFKFVNSRTKKTDGYYWKNVDDGINAMEKFLSILKEAKRNYEDEKKKL